MVNLALWDVGWTEIHAFRVVAALCFEPFAGRVRRKTDYHHAHA